MDSFGRTLAQAEPYLAEQADSMDVVIENAPQEFFTKYAEVPKDECEYIYTGMSFYKQLINHGGLMLHSSAVVVDGKAYLFTAASGTGKSTHTALYLRAFGSRAFILNDDKPALRFEDGGFFAYGTPWSGKTAQNTNVRVPVAGICVLHRGEKNEISRIYGKDAIFGIYAQTMHPQSAKYMDKLLSLIEKMIALVPIWELKCNMDADAPLVSYHAMSSVQ